MLSSLSDYYFHLIFHKTRFVLLLLTMLAFLFAWFSFNFRLDASSDSLVLENDQALRDSLGQDIEGTKVQESAQEFVLAIKLYYTIPLPVRIKLGAAEGWSYINNVTYIESYDYDNKEYRASNLLNFLDFSVDISLEDIFGKSLNNLWLGYSIHHRSGIFESAQQFGRITGGSNYQTGYLQYHF